MQSISTLVQQRVDRVIIQNETIRNGFAALPYLVMKDVDLSVGARLTYGFLLMYGWQEGSCFPGQKRMAEDMGISDRHLRRYLTELKEADYIRVERQDKRYNNTYFILDKKRSKKLRGGKVS